MNPQKIIVVDDDRFLLDNLKRLLGSNGYDVRVAASGEEGLAAVVEQEPDLMILDLGLPGLDGMSLCRRLRAKWTFPVLMLTARSDAMDKVIGLEVGADDYLTKPFEPSELVARVRAHLRRKTEYVAEASKDEALEIGNLKIDFDARDAIVAGKALKLTTREFELVAHLGKNTGRALSRESLFESVWGYDMEFASNSLDVFVYRLRQKLECAGCTAAIQTVRGYGYRFQVV